MIERLNTALEGRYRIERELGEGGMATVYLADDARHQRKVAIKVLRPELSAVIGAERFLAEIRTTANLQHPHILPLFDSGEADGLLFYVMPFVDGESLRDRLDRDKQLPVDEAVGLAAKIAGALQAAHSEGVIHRDIKPANILLSKGEPLIADFGIALAVQEAGSGRLTETGLSVGTPFYMSPEQATADRPVAPSTDVYALGCVLFEMLVGEPPYVGNTAQAILGKILTEEPRHPTLVRPAIRPNVEAVVLRSLEKLPADRFASAGDFLRALEDPNFRHRDEQVEGVAGGRMGSVSPIWRWTTAAFAVVALLLLGRVILGGAAPGAPAIRFEVELPDEAAMYLRNGVALDLAPNGSALVYVGVPGVGAPAQLWLHRFDQLEATPIVGTEGALNPRISPSGRAVAFIRDGALQRTSLDGGPPLTLIPERVWSGGGGVSWSGDGYIYAVVDGAIHRVPEAGGSVERIVDAQGSSASWMDALPDGRGLLFTRDGGDPNADTIQVIDLETREIRTLFPGAMARWADSGHIVYADGEGTLFRVPFDPSRLEVTGTPRPVIQNVQVNSGSASHFAISSTGTLAYVRDDGTTGGVPVWLNGAAGIDSISVPTVGAGLETPSISPDGRRIAFAHTAEGRNWDIWVLNLDDGSFTRLTFEGNHYFPFWSPDGLEVGFLRIAGDTHGLYSRRIDLSDEARLLRGFGSDQMPILGAWTPDGERLLYSVHVEEYMVAPPHPDSAATSWLKPPGSAGDFELSPDGRWVAYVSNESGVSEVFVRPFPGPGGQRQISNGGGTGPRWVPTGDTIVYVEPDDGGWMRAALRSASDPSVVERKVVRSADGQYDTGLFGWDLSPDGRILAIDLNPISGVSRGPVIVMNWTTELDRAEAGN